MSEHKPTATLDANAKAKELVAMQVRGAEDLNNAP